MSGEKEMKVYECNACGSGYHRLLIIDDDFHLDLPKYCLYDGTYDVPWKEKQ